MTYLFGYGTLINKESRAATSAVDEAIPFTVQGFRRGWYAPDRGCMAHGVIPDDDASVNGVIIPVHLEQLRLFDRREHDYHRIEVAPDVWMYMVDKFHQPSADRPICQSYVDVVLGGCLDLGEEFALHYLRSTEWEGPVLNDRASPLFPEGFHPERSTSIDRLLTGILIGPEVCK
ncbi:gamma-glutamylcyclotransferase [Candidatus Woesearchaeota archaeon]|nr:gamma-glutamylcyclotransferase [Candidatus Woesearchaeota archaeon]